MISPGICVKVKQCRRVSICSEALNDTGSEFPWLKSISFKQNWRLRSTSAAQSQAEQLDESSRWCSRRLYSYLLVGETTCKETPHFQWTYKKLSQIYRKLRSDRMDPKSVLGGPNPIARTGRSLLKNWSYTSNQCIYFSILLDWRSHLAKTLFILHKYIKCALL